MFILVWFFPIYHLQYSNQIPQTKIADLVQIAPKDLGQKSRKVIEDNINAKYANKVIQKIGLCICLYDLTYASDGLIGNQTGFVNVNGIFPYYATFGHVQADISPESWENNKHKKIDEDEARC
jgi:hypothetical protein